MTRSSSAGGQAFDTPKQRRRSVTSADVSCRVRGSGRRPGQPSPGSRPRRNGEGPHCQHRSIKFGWASLLKAATPSRRSVSLVGFDRTDRIGVGAVALGRACWRPPSPQHGHRGLPTDLLTSSLAVAAAKSCGVTTLHHHQRAASSMSRSVPLNNRYFSAAGPMSYLGEARRRRVCPAGCRSARRRSRCNTSQAVATSQPATDGEPRTAAMTGIGIVVNALRQTARACCGAGAYGCSETPDVGTRGERLVTGAPQHHRPQLIAGEIVQQLLQPTPARQVEYLRLRMAQRINATFRWRCSATRRCLRRAVAGAHQPNISASMSPPHGFASLAVIARRLMVLTCAASRVLWQHPEAAHENNHSLCLVVTCRRYR